MMTLTVDGPPLVALKQAAELVEIRDAQGVVIGYFAPVRPERAHLYDRPGQANAEGEGRATSSTAQEVHHDHSDGR